MNQNQAFVEFFLKAALANRECKNPELHEKLSRIQQIQLAEIHQLLTTSVAFDDAIELDVSVIKLYN
jgi:hypothetical protein